MTESASPPPPRLRFPPALMAAEISRLQPFLLARIVTVRPTLHGWVLGLQGPGRIHTDLLVSLQPGAQGLALFDPDTDGPLPPESILSPPPLPQQFLTQLEGWRIERAFAAPREPVAVFGLSAPPPAPAAEAPDPRPSGPWRTLVWELFGASGNAVLLSLEDRPELEDHWLEGRVLRRIHAAQGVARSLEVGEPYRLPRAVEHEHGPAQPPLSHVEWIDHLTWHWQSLAVEHLCRPVAAEITRLGKKIGALRAQFADDATIARTILEGQYLQAHPQRSRRGLAQLDPAADAAVWNLTQPLPLKPRLTVAENAAERFDQAHRWRKAAEYAAEHLPPIEAQLAAAQARLRALQDPAVTELSWADFVAAFLPSAAPTAGAGLKPRGAQAPRDERTTVKSDVPKFVRRFRSSDDFLIDVGKSARDNHQLTFKSAHGNDLLLHIAGVPGAHVIVRCKDKPPKGSDPQFPPATVLEAARLCLHYSSRKAVGGEVVIALVKDCRAGHKPGQVMIAHPKYLRVKADPADLQKVLDRKVAN